MIEELVTTYGAPAGAVGLVAAIAERFIRALRADSAKTRKAFHECSTATQQAIRDQGSRTREAIHNEGRETRTAIQALETRQAIGGRAT